MDADVLAGIVWEAITTCKDKKLIARYESAIKAVWTNIDEFDKIVDELLKFDTFDEQADYLVTLDAKDADKLLKSQMSKKSRSRHGQATEANFQKLLSAMIGERLLRHYVPVIGKSGGQGNRSNLSMLTDEELAKIAEDQNDVRRRIKNIASLKSTHKRNNADYETTDRWKLLIAIEAQLRSVLVAGTTQSAEVAEKLHQRTEIANMLEGTDITKMSKADAQAILEKMQSLINKPADEADKTEEPSES